MTKAKAKIIVLVPITLILIASISAIVFGVISRTSTRGTIEVSTDTLTATTAYTSKQEGYEWTYEYAGDTKEIEIATVNNSEFVLHRFYTIDKTANATNDDNLLSAIMVYYNDEYIGQLIDVIDNDIEIADPYVFVTEGKTGTDSLKFELHQAASNSVFDGKNIGITVTTYTENANYLNNIFVHSDAEFKRAIDDINSGLFETIPTIVLCNTITLANSYDILNPTTIYMNGATLNGTLVLNDTDALLTVLGEGTFNASVTLTSYDTTAAKELVIENVKNAIGSGLKAGTSKDVLGHYGFYNFTITESATATYTAATHVVSAPSVDDLYYSKPSYITVAGEKVTFKLLGSKTALLENTLKHLPANDSIITTDLFLPTYIPGENAVITWTSSNEDILSSDGKIAARRIDSEEVSLLAEIKVNDTVITNVYTFKVSAHNNEINFYKLVQEISPIVINNIYSSEADANNALYHLPIVDSTSEYDYRKSYDSPAVTKMFNWEAYRDIGLENITYEMTTEQQNLYEYITLENYNELYLNKTTLNNYARINITGDFGNDETYTTYINISISVGSDTQLLEKAFAQISEELADISVLGNILSTRISDGMANEKGDFSLNSVYLKDNDYTIEFSGASNIIDSITYNSTTKKYDFTINPEYFNEYETTVAFKATVSYRGGTSKSRTFYITVPAALHVDDFGTISLYNSLKYQTYLSLPSNERSGTSGYTKTTTKLVDSNMNYVLLRDIVGDTSYLTDYCDNDTLYLDKISYTSDSQYAEGVKDVELLINSDNSSDATDTYAYDFAKLIEWATGNTRQTADKVVSNTAAISGLTSAKANGADYLNDDEVAVLKACYKYYTGASDNDWNTMFNEIFNVAPGYIYTNSELLNAVIKALGSNNISFTSENFQNLFGKHMEILQRYAVATTNVSKSNNVWTNVAPCQQQYNSKYVWYLSNASTSSFSLTHYSEGQKNFTSNYNFGAKNGIWWNRSSWSGANANGTDGVYGGYYATPDFAADKTSYITSAELQVMMMFWLNACGNNLNTAITDTNQQIISSILSNDAGKYYSNYGISDFSYVGSSIINAFYACLEVPTYFTTDGVSKLVKYFYNNYNYNSTKYELPTYDGEVTTTFASALNNRGIPYVTNVDSLKAGLSYFSSLEELKIVGTSSLSAFLSENGIFTVYTRASLDNLNIYKLIMNYCASDYVNFDLSSISNYDSLTYLDLSNNKGIGSVNELVNVNRSNYTYVDISNIGISFEYQEFAIDNIARPEENGKPACYVWYTDSNENRVSSTDNTYASVVSDLSDFNKFITKYMYMSNVVYDENGNAKTINWRIDEGNDIYGTPILNGGTYPEISSIEEMNQLVSPYYYALEDFTYTYNGSNYSFSNKYLYEISFENGSLVKTTVGGPYETISDLSNISSLVDTTVPDMSSYVPYENDLYYEENIDVEGTTSYTSVTYFSQSNTKSNTLSETFEYNYYTYSSGTRQTEYTLPSRNNIRTYITNRYSSQYSNVSITSFSTQVKITSYNRNGNNNNALSDAWQHILTLNGTKTNNVHDYSPGLVYGEQYYVFNEFDLSSYYGKKAYMNYNGPNNANKSSESYFYPNSANFLRLERQSIYSIVLLITCSITYSSQSEITVNYTDGTSDSFNGYYASGYLVKKITGTTITYTTTEQTIEDMYLGKEYYALYTGSNIKVYDINNSEVDLKENTLVCIVPKFIYAENSRTREYIITGDIYTWEFFYIYSYYDYYNFSQNPLTYDFDDMYYASGKIDGELIQSIVVNGTTYLGSTIRQNLPTYTSSVDENDYYLPVGTYTMTQVSGFGEDWSTPLTSTWSFDSVYANPYISYVTKFSNSSHKLLDDQLGYYEALSNDGEYIVRYTGTTAQEGIYVESTSSTTTSYTSNYGYNLIINSNNELSWNEYATSLTNTTTNNMKTILDTANQHFGDNQYGAYYGMYYGYAGESMYDKSLGMYLKQYYVYRIMPNANNSAFEWQEVQKYYAGRTPSQMLLELGTGVSGVGDIYYAEGANAFNSFFPTGWYKVVIDEKTNIVNLVKYNDMAITISENYTRLENQKIHGISSDYLGYSGTFTTQISALYRVKNADNNTYTDYIKTYKLRFVGSLNS